MSTIRSNRVCNALALADLMRATPHAAAFDGDGWTFENKFGGYRVLARRSSHGVDLLPRSFKCIPSAFPEILAVMESLPNGTALDAEIIVLDEWRQPSYERLRRRAELDVDERIAEAAWRMPAMLSVFDCLFFNGRDIRNQPLTKRKAAAAQLVADLEHMRSVSFVARDGVAAFDAAVSSGAEALVAKRADSTYRPGKRPTWLKIKNPSYSRKTVTDRYSLTPGKPAEACGGAT